MRAIKKVRTLYSKISRLDILVNNSSVIQHHQNLYLTSKTCGVTENVYPEGELVISLTSYGNKLRLLYLTIESLLHQTLKPNKIILWLDKTKYSNRTLIPDSLKVQEERGLTIKLCEDVRSYTKLIPALESYPNSIIITTDDDIIYPIDFVERLYKAYQIDSNKIYFYRGHYILFDRKGKPQSYLDWVRHGANGCSIYNFPSGVSGILYPPKCFHQDIANRELFFKLCPYADDVWFKVMTMLKGVLCEKIETPHFDKQFVPIDVDEGTSLQNINVVHGGNDRQIKAVFNYYGIHPDNYK